MSNERVLIYGAAGHTGRFVPDELLARGIEPVLAGRNAARLDALPYDGLERRAVALDDADALHAALADVAVVVNVAGPFLDTALTLSRAAVAAGAPASRASATRPCVR